MTALRLGSRKGRVLLVGRRAACAEIDRKLAQGGYDTATADHPKTVLSVAARLKPEAILFADASDQEVESLQVIRQDADLRELPTLAHVPGGEVEKFRRFHLDDLVRSPEELTFRLEAALRARRLVERDARTQRRMEILLEIAQAATSSLELDQLLRLAVDRAAKGITADRFSIILVEGDSPRSARVVAAHDRPNMTPSEIDLIRYPEVRRALESRQAVHITDVEHDPLMAEVREQAMSVGLRSVLVQPLVCAEDILGALVVRLTQTEGTLGREELEFAQAVAASLANALRNARLHATLKRKREELESAYVDRYRELNEANRRLKEMNRLKDDIIAVCSHDLRAPLNVLLGHGQLLLDSELAQQQSASAEAIVRQGRKILSLVESLLEKGRGEAARLSLDARLIDVAELCQEGAAELEIIAAERGVSLRSEAPESLMAIGDEIKVREVLQNLLTNAIHHAREAGEVVVRAQRLRRPDGEVARISVQDDGAGVPQEDLHLIFDRYRHGPGGTGLGLAICKEFVELHGGEIWAEAPKGGGAAFVFTLPLAKEQSQAMKDPPKVLLGEQARVLVVEDEPEIAAVLTEILRTRYRVEIARDGAEGLAKARALHPDLLVMDVFLPKMDGLDAAVALKSSSDTADIPVILVSAHQGVAEKVRALNLGAVDYMGKPFQAMELINRTERALKLARTERELQRSVHLLKRSGSDGETGLLDRTGLESRLEPEVSRCRRYNRPLSLAVLKPTGPVGEKLRTCATLVRQRVRSPDVVGHIGNGVFAVVMPECDGEQAQMVLLRITSELERETGVKFRCLSLDVGKQEANGESLIDLLLSKVREGKS